ncbi:PREDICTED: auxilin-related protein 1-like [Populus euphratica]|uniref:Auxilin-related protein 1-like n=1 Tax=Populus euphratica TaxID=75702 RepID=A0AAJ6TC67_POPEU|nr:PREDICTED: auxilin-related protein 1-like [Populus euphratica]
MDDFPGLLARDFGYKPQGKSAPMAPPRNTNIDNTNFNLGSGGSVHIRSPFSNKSAPIFDDHVGTDSLLFNNAFDGPLKYSESRGGASTTTSSFDYDSIFKDQNSKSASLPVFDKPVYDEDIFDGLPGLKNSSTDGDSASAPKFDNVFASVSSPPKQHRRPPARESSPFDDLLGNLGKKETESKTESRKVEKNSTAFDDLLPGFGGSSSPSVNRSTSESGQFQKPSSNSARPVPGVMEDPFVVLESTSTPPTSSSGLFTDPLEEISKISNTGNTKIDSSSVNMAVFDDLDHFDDLGKSVPPEINKGGENKSPLRTRSRSSSGGAYSSVSKESVNKYPLENAVGHSQKKTPDDYQESHEAIFDMPAASTDFHRSFGQNVSPPSYVDINANEINSSPRSEEVSESSDDVWLTVSEIPLFTQPTSALPPSRPPPPRPPRISKSEFGSFSSTNSRKKFNEYPSFQNSTSDSQNTRPDHASRNSVTSQIDELEDFVTARTQNNVNEFADIPPGDDADKTSSSAASAAMKEAVDKAEAKFRQMREREYLKAARNKEAGQLDKDMQDAQQRELKERHERFDRERQQREKEEEEREQRRFEKERERAREIEREREEKEREQRRLERERERAREIEREREKGRQAVERATREARERAATEARLKAERSAVEKISAGARERAERAAVQRAHAEARERAAAEAKERAERAAAEARERANAEVREREARERAAVARAEADARFRAERAAVERAAAEARERAAAAAAARANQQKSENDLESFFSTRTTSAQRPRTNTSDPFSDSQNKGGPEPVRRTSVGATSSVRKTSSTTNVVDDLTSIFGGGTGSSGEFQEVEGETEERRKARMERHQRTQERAAKALAEKNQRDLQAQRDQAERHRIAETLDVEIKRWAAGKEGNLRALLSTLQYVLWPECGWQPVSLTDLITGAAVKKAYRKATLCIHPDKVQQKGANLQQKYVAEKVFDLLKEAWNKFNSEELF